MFITPFWGGGPTHTGSSNIPRSRESTTSNIDKPQHKRSRVNKSPSRAIVICYNLNFNKIIKEHTYLFMLQTLAVPYRSMLGTICKAAYFASNRFCLLSVFSPSLVKGLGNIFWKGAAWSKSQTSS